MPVVCTSPNEHRRESSESVPPDVRTGLRSFRDQVFARSISVGRALHGVQLATANDLGVYSRERRRCRIFVEGGTGRAEGGTNPYL